MVKEWADVFRWVYATRAIGVALLAYAMLSPHDPDRGTFILGGLGFLGSELVASKEPKK
jgi:hypothetical protein